MLRFLPAVLRGAIAVMLLVLNTLFWCPVLFLFALVKLLLPFPAVRRRIDPLLNGIASCWISGNSAWMALVQRVSWDVEGVQSLRYADWYLVNCNHQSWVDILVLQHVLNRRIPMLKFFLKRQLLYVPVIGLAWWALDFPFLRRHSIAELKARPELREHDREAARRACAKFALVPTSVISFAEGTRFTRAKHDDQGSPYRYLLRPKAGALAMAIGAMGRQFHSLLDATIVYPRGTPTFWQFLCGRTDAVIVRVRQLQIPADFVEADYAADTVFRRRFHQWLEQQWQEKDRLIGELLQQSDTQPIGLATPARAR